MSGPPAAMAVLIEPAPYMVRLLDELRAQWAGPVDGWFIGASVTQGWSGAQEGQGYGILPRSQAAALGALWREMRRTQPAIVFVAGWSHPLIVAAILMARLSGARVVSMSDTWTSASSGLRALSRRRLLRLVHRFTPAGRRQARYLRAQGVPADRIFPANMTSDTAGIRAALAGAAPNRRQRLRAEMGVADHDPVFLFVGRLEPVKGPDLLLAAFTALPGTQDARLVVVGDGTMRDQVIAAAALDPRILFRGRLEGEALWEQFAAADILVVPSRSEAWGLVVNEALAAGLGVIVHDCCGCIDDLVIAGETGTVVPTGDAAALRQSLLDLCRDPARIATFKRNGAALIATWTTQAWAANILAAWRDALGASPARRDATCA
ncbi:MAG: glycosyltransferase [Rhodobacteraceae bacterium]|nr:MAG: glycosyltransferase [Paracoccaceae bacterium]